MSPAGGPEASEAWVADPSITWRIALTARLVEPPDPTRVAARLEALHRAQGWPGAGDVVIGPVAGDLRRDLGERRDTATAVGVAGHDLVVSAHHSRVDGDGLLAVLASVSGLEVRAPERRTTQRAPSAGRVRTVAGRLREALVSPPAPLQPPGPSGSLTVADAYADLAVPGSPGTSALVVAAAAAVGDHQRAVGGRDRHVAIAVGVGGGRPGHDGGTGTITDRSALVRLRDAEWLPPDAVREAVHGAPVQTAPPSGGAAGSTRWALRLLGSRLGSSLLVSHLGRVEAAGVTRLVFHPVTAGGSGVSLGAVTLDGPAPTTVLSLRARGTGSRGWTHDGLEQLLQAVVRQL